MNVPYDHIFAEPMPDKAFKLLIFLWHEARKKDCSCAPSYAKMRRIVGGRKGSLATAETISKAIAFLKKADWFRFIQKTKPRRFYLHIPQKLRIRQAEEVASGAIFESPKIVQFPVK